MTWMGDPAADAYLKAVAAAQSGIDPTLARVMENYGYLAGFLNHPEIGPLLREAAQKGWSAQILQGRLSQTKWWAENQAAARELEVLYATDPKEWTSRVEAKIREVDGIAKRAGVPFENYDQIKTLAIALLQNPNLAPETVNQMIFAHARFDPKKAVGGTMGATMSGIKAAATDMLVPMSEQTAFNWSKRIMSGLATQEGLQEYLRQQAKSRWSHFAEQIDAGATMKDLFDPYKEQTAQLLEVAPEAVNLMEPRWQRMIDNRDPETGQTRAMTLSEAAEYVRRSGDYDRTLSATNRVGEFTENLLRTFGAVKG